MLARPTSSKFKRRRKPTLGRKDWAQPESIECCDGIQSLERARFAAIEALTLHGVSCSLLVDRYAQRHS